MKKHFSDRANVITYDRVSYSDPKLTATTSKDVVINCAGALKPTINERGTLHAIQANSVLPHMLSKYCARNGIKVFHFSSDCVFAGNIELHGRYIESDTPDGTDVYARTKVLGQPKYGMLLRTSLIGEEDRDSTRGLLQWVLNSKESITGYSNCYWNGVTALQLCKIVSTILDKDWYDNGLYHIHSPGYSHSKYAICEMINVIYDLQLTVESTVATDIMGTNIEYGNTLNRALGSEYKLCRELQIPELDYQIKEQKEWHELQS